MRKHCKCDGNTEQRNTLDKPVLAVLFSALCCCPTRAFCCSKCQPACPVLHSTVVPLLVQRITLFVKASSVPILYGIPLPCVQSPFMLPFTWSLLHTLVGQQISGVLVSWTPKGRGGKTIIKDCWV
ncbi:hypothetical protein MRX96_005092 [Rhipicephalus microplus]